METKISKIQIRQDTAANWATANPVLALGELGFETPNTQYPYGAMKIGDGKTPWNELNYQTIAGKGLQDITIQEANGKLYGRQWNPNAETPHWQEIILPGEDLRKSFADLMACPYDEEIDMNYNFLGSDGKSLPVFAIKKHFEIDCIAGEYDSKSVDIDMGRVKNILQIGGSFRVDDDHYYALPCHSAQYYVNVSFDEEHDGKTITINNHSVSARTKAPLDIFIIYAKDLTNE